MKNMYRNISIFLAAFIASCATPAIEDTVNVDKANPDDITIRREIDGIKLFEGELYAEAVLIDHSYQQELFEGDVFLFKTKEQDTLSFRITPAEDDEYGNKMLERLKKKESMRKTYKIIYYYALDVEARRSLEMCDFSEYDIVEIVGENETFNSIRYVKEEKKDDKL